MATDNSEPRSGLIVVIGLLSIVTLIGLRSALQSYFVFMTESEVRAKVLTQPHEMLEHVRADETRRLESGNIQQAMAQISSMGTNRPALIAPQASTDMAPMQGWTQMPHVLAPSGTSQPSMAPAPAPASTAPATTGGPTATPGPTGATAPSEPAAGQGTAHAGTQPGSAPVQGTSSADHAANPAQNVPAEHRAQPAAAPANNAPGSQAH